MSGKKVSTGTPVDVQVLQSWLDRFPGRTMDDHADKLGIDERTLRRMLAGDRIRPSTIESAAKGMGIDPRELVDGRNRFEIGHPEWMQMVRDSTWEVLPNGIRYQRVRLSNRVLLGSIAQGKCYDVSKLPKGPADDLQEYFLRHPRVVRRVMPSGYFPANYSVFFNPEVKHWWSIDEWIDGTSLDAILRVGPLGGAELYPTMLHVAEALTTLHREAVVRRSLTPANIALRKPSRLPVLTDLELCKVSDCETTVKACVIPNPYLAPEAKAPAAAVEFMSDVYSWGRTFIHAATGRLPAHGQESAHLQSSCLPTEVKDVVIKAVSLNPECRPKNIDGILGVLRQVVSRPR